jgi:hypothetical protein
MARELNFGHAKLIDGAESLTNEVRKMLFGLLNSLNAEPHKKLKTTIRSL